MTSDCFMRHSLLTLAFVGACTRAAPIAPRPSSPPPPRSARLAPVVDAAPSVPDLRAASRPIAALPEQATRFVAVSAREVVDVDTGRVIALDERAGHVAVLGGSDALQVHERTLTSVSLPEGTVRWRLDLDVPCTTLARNAQWIFCATSHSVTALRWSDGSASTWPVSDPSPITHLVATLTRAVVLTRALRVTVVDPAAGETRLTLPPPSGALDRGTASDPLVASRDGQTFCRVDRMERWYGVSCHDANGAQRFAGGPIEHTSLVESREGDQVVQTTTPYVYLRGATIGHLFWDSFDRRPGVTRYVVTSLRDGHVAGVTTSAAPGLVEDASGTLRGVLATEDGAISFHDPGARGRARWSIANPSGDNTAESVVVDDRVCIATFHRIASGARLGCWGIGDGAEVWRGEVEQLMVDHSRYMNDVRVFARAGAVVLVGYETGGSHVQAFDRRTGSRRFAVLRRY